MKLRSQVSNLQSYVMKLRSHVLYGPPWKAISSLNVYDPRGVFSSAQAVARKAGKTPFPSAVLVH